MAAWFVEKGWMGPLHKIERRPKNHSQCDALLIQNTIFIGSFLCQKIRPHDTFFVSVDTSP